MMIPPLFSTSVGCSQGCVYKFQILCRCSSIFCGPQFVGLRNQNNQVHGVSGEDNIVSDPGLQYNSHFILLNEGKRSSLDKVYLDS
jgi:competence transcription factor ComK